MLFESIVDWALRIAGVIGLFSLALAFLGKLISKYYADSMLEKRKAELQKELERHKAELGVETEKLKGELSKETESHKLRLKKQEILFLKKIEATTAFINLRQQIEPTYSHPEMEWDDACEEVARNMFQIENSIRDYLSVYGAVVTKDSRERIAKIKILASHNKFDSLETLDEPISEEASAAGGEIIEVLRHIEEDLIAELQD
ncbi:hypothetical protein RPPS3_18800 [Rhodopseudomonas palustris]|nr:hypothetical protein RPPS3_18800 [Rhodopseudomonas palustris]